MVLIKTYSGEVPNANKTLKNTIDVDDLISKIKNGYLRSELSKFKSQREINLWDLGKRAAEHIRVGDLLIIKSKSKIYNGQIIGVIDDKDGEIGGRVGWAKQYGKPWTNVIVLKNVKTSFLQTKDRLDDFIKDHEKDPYQTPKTKNLLRIDGKEQEAFLKLLGGSSLPTVAKLSTNNEILKLDLPDWLTEVIQSIKKLKEDTEHQERGHESLIEQFFEKLHYERVTDIKFQRGHIDIEISIENKPLMVVEVKKYWNLNVNKDQDTVKQAYNYALANGARFVIISNGDYYAVFDRDLGRTYTSNLKGEFVLSELNKDDLSLINFLKKDNLHMLRV